jgi:hypothetical protein
MHRWHLAVLGPPAIIRNPAFYGDPALIRSFTVLQDKLSERKELLQISVK